jgi:AcrR family transcriptional regulator
MRKGEATKRTILDHAFGLATAIGLDGLSIGRLADELSLSKSGLFAHFRSKEALQIQVLETAAERFAAAVVRPALKAPRGSARLWALFDHWLAWGQRGGCVFFAAASELDDQPGPVRDALVGIQKNLSGLLAGIVAQAQRDGLFKPVLSPEQAAQDLYGIMLSFHFHHRLLNAPAAEDNARAAFARLLASLAN